MIPGGWITGSTRPEAQAVFVADWTNYRQTNAGGAILYIMTASQVLLRPDEVDPNLGPWYDDYATAVAAATAWLHS